MVKIFPNHNDFFYLNIKCIYNPKNFRNNPLKNFVDML